MFRYSSEKKVRLISISYYVTLFIWAFIGLVLMIENAIPDIGGSLIIVLIGLIWIFQFFGMMSVGKDERAAKIGMKSISFSWAASLIVSTLCLMLEAFSVIELGGYRILGAVLFTMMIALASSNLYYSKRGDPEMFV